MDEQDSASLIHQEVINSAVEPAHNGDSKSELPVRLDLNSHGDKSLQSQGAIDEKSVNTIINTPSLTVENQSSSQDIITKSSPDTNSDQSLQIIKIKEEPFHLVDYDTDGTTDNENEDTTKNDQQSLSTAFANTNPSISSTVCTNQVPTDDIWNDAIMDNVEAEKPTTMIPEKVVLPLPAFFHDYGRKESSDSSDSESDSSDSSVSVLSIESADSSSDTNCVIIENKVAKSKQSVKIPKKRGNLNPYKTPGELCLEDLPPIEDLYITVPEKDILHIGKVSSIVQTQVIIQTFENQRALDLDTVLFLKDGTSLGKVFDVFGRVAAPFYSVRFNTEEDIKNKGIEVGCDVYCAPAHNEVTKFVFTEKLLTQKGSDASWKDNNEPPEECLEFSDDEQEKLHKMKLKAKRKGVPIEDGDSDLQIVHSNVTKGKNPRNGNKRGSHTGPLVRPNRFNAPTPDLNTTNDQSVEPNVQRWNNFYQPQNNGSFQQNRGGHPNNNQWGTGPQYSNYQTGPSLLSNPYVFGTPPSMFNNGYPNNQYNYPNPNIDGQFHHNPVVPNNQGFQPSWPPFSQYGPNQFNHQSQFIGPQNRLESPQTNQFYNMCFTSPPPPPPPPPPQM